MQRRKFLQIATIGGGAALLPGCSLLETDQTYAELENSVRRYRIIGSTNQNHLVYGPDDDMIGAFENLRDDLSALKNGACVPTGECETIVGQVILGDDEANRLLTLDRLLLRVPHPLSQIAYGTGITPDALTEQPVFELQVDFEEAYDVEYGIPNEIRSLSKSDVIIRYRNYLVRVSLEKHPLYACINKNVWHAGALIKTTNPDKELFNLGIMDIFD